MILKHMKWDITSRCNLRCAHCSIAKNYFEGGVKEISLEQKLKIIDKLVEGGVGGISLLGGEPLTMGDGLFSIIEYAVSKGLKVSFVTNGLLLSGDTMERIANSGIDHITISMDGASKETHEFIRGKNTFEKLIDNIRQLAMYREKNNISFKININTVLNKLNFSEIDDLIDLCLQLGVDQWILLTLGCIGSAEDNIRRLSLTPDEEIDAARRVAIKYSACDPDKLTISHQFYPLVLDYLEKKFNLHLPKSNICCSGSINFGFISPDGNLYPCDRVPGDHLIGYDIDGTIISQMSLLENSFYEIWNSEYYIKMFNLIMSKNSYKNHHPCNHCKYLKNNYCNPCPLYSLESGAVIKTCQIAEEELGDISGHDDMLATNDALASRFLCQNEGRSGGDRSSGDIAHMTPVKTLGVRSFGEEELLLLLNPYNVEFSYLNLAGKAVWDLIDGKNSIQEIADELIEIAYEFRHLAAPRATGDELHDELNRKVMSFFEQLYGAGLIKWLSKDQPLMTESQAS